MLTPETMLIVAGAAFLLFGGKKLPELGRSLGQGIREFKSGTQGLQAELEASVAQPSVRVAPPVTAVSVPNTVTAVAALPSRPVTQVVELGTPILRPEPHTTDDISH